MRKKKNILYISLIEKIIAFLLVEIVLLIATLAPFLVAGLLIKLLGV